MPARTPSEVSTLFRDAFNARDIQALAALYEPGAVLVADGRPVEGAPAIRAALEGYLQMQVRMTLEIRSMVQPVSEGLAVLHCAWRLDPVSPQATGGTTQGLSTEVVRRQPDGTWLFVIDIPNSPEQTRVNE